MSLSTKLSRFFVLCTVMCLSLFVNAQVWNDIQVHHSHGPRTNAISQKIDNAHHEGIKFRSPEVASLANSDPKALKLFGISQADFLNLDPSQLRVITKEKPEAITLSFPVQSMGIMELDLVRVDVVAESFYVTTSDGRKPEFTLGTFYQGVARNHVGYSVAAITVFDDKILGMVSLDEENINLEAIPNEPLSLIIFNEKDIIKRTEMSCLADELEAVIRDPNETRAQMAAGDCIRVYLECDKALHDNKGGVQATVDWITSVFNNVKTLYTNESINTTISEIFVWTTADTYSKTDSYTALTQFKNLRPTFNGDLAHLCALGGNNIGGVAWLDALCTTYKYAYSNISSTYNNVPTYSWTVMVMTHEMGHNVGSNHTQWCGWTGGALDNCYTTEGGCPKGPAPTNGGTIMSYCHLTSYGINLANGFGPQPGDKIRARVVAAGCLGQSCGASCGTPTGLAISNITNTSAIANWNSVSGANSYDFEYKLNTAQTWSVVNVTNTTYSMTGLTLGSLYNTRVKAKCSGGNSSYTSIVNFTTTGGSCSTPTGFKVTNITTSSATSSWNAVTGALSYNFQYKLSTSQTWSTFNTTATSVNLTGMTPGTSYDVRVQTVCSGGTSAYTATITFITLTSTYCTSKGNNANYEWVARVNIGTIDRTSGKDAGYYNGTHLVSDVVKGTSYTLSHQVGRSSGSYSLHRRVWIDWNRDNDFLDAGEEVLAINSSSTALIASSITVPTGASTGTTRMRVSIKYGNPAPTSCLTFTYGEVEDYTLNIKTSGNLINNPSDELNKEIQVQPNPFTDKVNINYYSSKDQNANVSIFNLLGQVQTAFSTLVVEGQNNLEINLSTLVPGQYLLRLEADNRVIQRMIIKNQ